MVTHDDEVAAAADRIVRMRDGRIESATPADAPAVAVPRLTGEGRVVLGRRRSARCGSSAAGVVRHASPRDRCAPEFARIVVAVLDRGRRSRAAIGLHDSCTGGGAGVGARRSRSSPGSSCTAPSTGAATAVDRARLQWVAWGSWCSPRSRARRGCSTRCSVGRVTSVTSRCRRRVTDRSARAACSDRSNRSPAGSTACSSVRSKRAASS